MNGTAKGSENMFMAGMAGSFLLALATILQALPIFKIKLPGAIGLVAVILALLGFIAVGVGFMAVNKAEQKPVAQFAGISFIALGLVYLLLFIIAPKMGSFKLMMIMGYAMPVVGAAAFGLGGLAISQTSESWGSLGKLASSTFYATAVVFLYLLLAMFIRKLGGSATVYVRYAFIALQIVAFVTAGLGFMEMKKRAG